MRLIQFWDTTGARRVALSSEAPDTVRLIADFSSVYAMAREAIRRAVPLAALVEANLSAERLPYEPIIAEGRLLPPLDHPDPARCVVSLTGLTHLGSAQARDQLHAALAQGTATDSMRMFQRGIEGGKPAPGSIGAQPEWAYKGDGRCIVAPEHALSQPAYAEDGGEEAEIAGLYVIGDDSVPYRVGFALGNEFADHTLERANYLYLAHSKLRECTFGPELLLGELPQRVEGTVRVWRDENTLWERPFVSGEMAMCHSIANLEHHHFKYELFGRPGDVHVHFFGANGVSFADNVKTQDGDRFEIAVELFGRPLRNPLRVASDEKPVQVRSL